MNPTTASNEHSGENCTRKKTKKRRFILVLLIILGVFFLTKFLLLPKPVTEEGKVKALKTLELKTPAEGVLIKIFVHNSEKVKKDQALFEFKNDTLEMILAHALYEKKAQEQTLKNIKSLTEHTKRSVLRGKALYENGVIAKSKFEEVALGHLNNEILLANGLERLKELSTDIKTLKKKQASLLIKAPLDGVFLGELSGKEGTYFKEAEGLGFVFSPDHFYLEVFLKEKEAKFVKTGDDAEILFKAFPGIFKGKVTEVEEEVTEKIEKVFKTKYVFKIKVLLYDFPEGIRPGMRGEVKIFPVLKMSRKGDR